MCLHCKFYYILWETLSVCVNGLNPYLCKTCGERWWWWCFSENVYEIEVLWTWWSMNVGYDCKKCNIAILVGALPLKIKWKGSMGWWGGFSIFNTWKPHTFSWLWSIFSGCRTTDGWWMTYNTWNEGQISLLPYHIFF